MPWELSEAEEYITVPMRGNKVEFGAGLRKFRRNLVMFRGAILTDTETTRNSGEWWWVGRGLENNSNKPNQRTERK